MSQPFFPIKPAAGSLLPGARPVAPSPPAVAASWAPNRRVPGAPYRIIRPLGAGGMGEVYEVEDERTGRRLALKAIHRRFCRLPDLVQRFRDEARVLGQLHDHPNLVEIVYVDESSDGRVYLVMQLLKGCSLEHELGAQHDAPVPYEALVPWACGVAGQVLDALAGAHAIGVFHRDIKPANIFLQAKGPVKLLDFGLAGFVAPRSGIEFITEPGQVVGTPAYMPPERLQGGAADARTDVFSVGVVLWEMLAGERAINAPDATAAAEQMVVYGVPPLASRPGSALLPPALVRAVDRATAYEAGRRFGSVDALAAALRGAARGLSRPAGLGPLVGLATAPVPGVGASRSKATTRKVRFGVPTPPPSSPPARAPAEFGVLDLGRDRRGPSPSRRASPAARARVLAKPVAPTAELARASHAGRPRRGLTRVVSAALDAWQGRLRTPWQQALGLVALLAAAYLLGTMLARCGLRP